MIIGIDLDDTLFDFVPLVLDKYNKAYNDNLQDKDITNFGTNLFIKKECKDIFAEFVDDKLIANCKPKENAVEVINWLHSKYDIVFVTAAYPYTVKARHELLKQTFSWYERKHLFVCPNKTLLNLNFLIDDCLDNHIGGKYCSIIYSAPWNNNIQPKLMFRADNWLEVKNIFVENII